MTWRHVPRQQGTPCWQTNVWWGWPGSGALHARGPYACSCMHALPAPLAGLAERHALSVRHTACYALPPTQRSPAPPAAAAVCCRRYSKTGLELAQVAEGCWPRRWGGRWLNPHRMLLPLGQVPVEALGFLQRCACLALGYTVGGRNGCSKTVALHRTCMSGGPTWLSPVCRRRYREWRHAQAEPAACTLPGRVMLLARQAAADPPAQGVQEPSRSAGSGWWARWLSGGELAEGGVRMSRHVAADHWISRMLGVLAELAPAGSS